MRVIFDASKLKHPNTGLYHFTKELALELERLSSEYEVDMQFVVESSAEELGKGAKRLKYSFLDSIFGCNKTKCQVQHTPFQFFKFKKRSGAKQILTVHDLNFLVEKSEAKQQKYLKKLQREIDQADEVVAISEFTKSEVLKHCELRGKEVQVIYNGCNIPQTKPQSPAYQPQSKFLFGLGTILPKKNWHTLPCLLVDNDLELVIAGAKSNYCEQILAEAQKYGVEQRVHLVGTISEADKSWYLANCEVFVFPSVAEGFGLPVIEAMYYGKQLLISPIAPLKEIAGENATYFDANFTPKLMQNELKTVLNSPKNAEKIKQNALKFSWENAAKSYLNLYKELVIKK